MHHVGCMTGPEPYMVQGNIALFLWCTTSVVRHKSLYFDCHSGLAPESRVPGENQDPVFEMVPDFCRDDVWMPPYQARGKLLKLGMTEKAVYGETLIKRACFFDRRGAKEFQLPKYLLHSGIRPL